MKEIRCPNCGTSFMMETENAVTELKDGINYLVPETIRNENVTKADKVTQRMDALKEAGIDVSKLQALMQKDADLKNIFNENDPVIEELNKGGFIRNPELFRRWITAQTFRILKSNYGWTATVKRWYNRCYVFKMSKKELQLLCKLVKKSPEDRRFEFFTLASLKQIFEEIVSDAYIYNTDKADLVWRIRNAGSYSTLNNIISSYTIRVRGDKIPTTWLNCFKGAGAYYTLQNIIRTHGLIIPGCKDMNDSLETVESLFKKITSYLSFARRWDLMMSLLIKSVKETNFELKY